jgi:hypothetical protein
MAATNENQSLLFSLAANDVALMMSREWYFIASLFPFFDVYTLTNQYT